MAHVAVPPTSSGRKKAAESRQSPFSCRGFNKELLKFDITKSQLVVSWFECHSKTELLEALVIVYWWNIPAVPISLSSQKGLCASCMKISACGATSSIFRRVKEAVKIAKAALQQPTLLYLPKSGISVHTDDVF